MILGIERVVDVRNVEPGQFYLRYEYDGDPVVFQCIRIGELDDGVPDLRALWFAPGTDRPFGVENLPDHGPVVALADVHIRVDAPTLSGTNYTTTVRAGAFLIAGNEAFVAAPTGVRGWTVVNISTGRTVADNWRPDWVAFSRWLIVINENGEEIPIASFGETEST